MILFIRTSRASLVHFTVLLTAARLSTPLLIFVPQWHYLKSRRLSETVVRNNYTEFCAKICSQVRERNKSHVTFSKEEKTDDRTAMGNLIARNPKGEKVTPLPTRI